MTKKLEIFLRNKSQTEVTYSEEFIKSAGLDRAEGNPAPAFPIQKHNLEYTIRGDHSYLALRFMVGDTVACVAIRLMTLCGLENGRIIYVEKIDGVTFRYFNTENKWPTELPEHSHGNLTVGNFFGETIVNLEGLILRIEVFKPTAPSSIKEDVAIAVTFTDEPH